MYNIKAFVYTFYERFYDGSFFKSLLVYVNKDERVYGEHTALVGVM